MVYMKY